MERVVKLLMSALDGASADGEILKAISAARIELKSKNKSIGEIIQEGKVLTIVQGNSGKILEYASKNAELTATNEQLVRKNKFLNEENMRSRARIVQLENLQNAHKNLGEGSLSRKMTKLETENSDLRERLDAVSFSGEGLKSLNGYYTFQSFQEHALRAYQSSGTTNLDWKMPFSKIAGISDSTIQKWRIEKRVPELFGKFISELRKYEKPVSRSWTSEDHELLASFFIANMNGRKPPSTISMVNYLTKISGIEHTLNMLKGPVHRLRANGMIPPVRMSKEEWIAQRAK
jgi:hypothetical protein